MSNSRSKCKHSNDVCYRRIILAAAMSELIKNTVTEFDGEPLRGQLSDSITPCIETMLWWFRE